MHRTAARVLTIVLLVLGVCAWVDGQTLPSSPSGSSFTPPAANACQSLYDRFYENEPGVYAYWAMCESSSSTIYDYSGLWDFIQGSNAWGGGGMTAGVSGPVPDGETAMNAPNAIDKTAAQDIPMNGNQGTVATWISAAVAATGTWPLGAVSTSAVAGLKSGVFLGTEEINGQVCFVGQFTNSTGTQFQVPANPQQCPYLENSWHRVVFTWNQGTETLYVDGAAVATGTYTGVLDTAVFYYSLFPGWPNVGVSLTLAKALMANQAWSAAQVGADYVPTFPNIPNGGVYIDRSTTLGTIHKDVLGMGDMNQDISTPAAVNALNAGVGKYGAGITSVRYANGVGGILADEADWATGNYCNPTYTGSGWTATFEDGPMFPPFVGDSIDNYIPTIAQPNNLDVIFTVNYGTNPTGSNSCSQGGDPVANGADVVTYTNVTKKYGIKHWEIGNEQFAYTTSPDLHPNPNTGASYAQYEPAFYNAMKAVDPTIQIAVPFGLNNYGWAMNWTEPMMADGALYDAIVYHNYPVNDPITDGDTLYGERVASNLGRTRGYLTTAQTALLNAGKSPDAIWITEWNGEQNGNMWSKQTLGAVEPMFAAVQLAEYMRAGVQLASWWAQGIQNYCDQWNYDNQAEAAYNWYDGCGDTALVYTDDGGGEMQVGLKMGDITPAARAFQLLSQSGFVTEGESMLQTWSDVQNAPWLLSYGATHGSNYALILINRDEFNSHEVPVTLNGLTSGAVTQWTWGKAQYDQTAPVAIGGSASWEAAPAVGTGSWSNGTYMATLPPWSVSVLITEQAAATPTFTPGAGSYNTPQSVTISDSTPNATIYYTTDDTTPNQDSTVYAGAVSVTTSETIQAIALAPGYSNSAVGSAAYTMVAPASAPTFNPPAGTYSATQFVTIRDTTPGTTIYYTTDGSTPTDGSMAYTAPITVAATETINAIALGGGYSGSGVASAAYAITTPAPDIMLNISPVSLTLQSGKSATVAVTVTPLYGFSSAVTFACSGLPTGSSCSFSPATVTPSGSPATTQLTISTSATTTSTSERRKSFPFLHGTILAFGLFLVGRKRLRQIRALLAVLILTLGIFLTTGCGGTNAATTPQSVAAAVTVTATSGNMQQTSSFTLIVQQ